MKPFLGPTDDQTNQDHFELALESERFTPRVTEVLLLSFICIRIPLPLTEGLEAELNQEGRRTLRKARRQQTRGSKQVGGIRSTWALWECQLGRTKAICETAK